MPLTSTNYTSIGYEQAWDGVSSPVIQILPTTGGGPMSNLTTTVSEVIRADRMIDDLVLTDNEVSGDINYELSYDPYKPLLISLLRDSNTPSVVNITGIAATATTTPGAEDGTLTGTGIGTAFPAGTYISINNMTVTSLDGVYLVKSATANEVVLYDDIILDAGATGTANVIRYVNGAAAADEYLFRKHVTCDTNESNFFYPGCSISTASFNFETGSILNGAIGIFGTTEDALDDTELTGTAYDGQTETAVPAYSIMNAVTSVADISLAGLTAGSCFQNFNLSVDNGTQGAKCIGTLGAVDVTDFTLNVTADITMYFCSLDIYKKFINSESFSVKLALRDGDGNALAITLPKCKFETLDVPIDGKDNFLTLNGSLRALREPTDDYMIGFDFMDDA